MESNWTVRLNAAIDYLEANLPGEASIREAARVACCSLYHFHRTFAAVVGETPAEYVRRRKLTLAAGDLMDGSAKVLDVAMDYGYDSPNAFTRAFRKMHGVNPGEVRSLDKKLSAYRRAKVDFETLGEKDMKYRIVEKPAFSVLGKAKQFTNENFFKEAPAFWKDYVSSDEYLSLWNRSRGRWGDVSEAPLMSVYLPDENGERDEFTDVLGIERTNDCDAGDFEIVEIPAARYAEFDCTYGTAVKAHKYIYGEWFPSTNYERDIHKPDIAAYFPTAFQSIRNMGVRWWIPVVKRT